MLLRGQTYGLRLCSASGCSYGTGRDSRSALLLALLCPCCTERGLGTALRAGLKTHNFRPAYSSGRRQPQRISCFYQCPVGGRFGFVDLLAIISWYRPLLCLRYWLYRSLPPVAAACAPTPPRPSSGPAYEPSLRMLVCAETCAAWSTTGLHRHAASACSRAPVTTSRRPDPSRQPSHQSCTNEPHVHVLQQMCSHHCGAAVACRSQSHNGALLQAAPHCRRSSGVGRHDTIMVQSPEQP